MDKKENILEAIAKELTKQLDLCNEAMSEAALTMGRLNSTPDDYDEAWSGFAATSIMHHQFLALKNFVDAGDVKMSENYIRFTLYQIEQATNHNDLNKDESTGDVLLDAKTTIYQIFKTYLKHFED